MVVITRCAVAESTMRRTNLEVNEDEHSDPAIVSRDDVKLSQEREKHGDDTTARLWPRDRNLGSFTAHSR